MIDVQIMEVPLYAETVRGVVIDIQITEVPLYAGSVRGVVEYQLTR